MEYITYNDELGYDSLKTAKEMKVKLGHAAIFNRNTIF